MKADLKTATGVETSRCAKKVDLASLKPEIDKLDIDKLETTPVDSKKLSYVLDKKVIKKDVYDELVKKVNAIQIMKVHNVVRKTDYDTRISEIVKKLLYEFNK